MIKNNIKIVWRSLKNQPFYYFLNISGLAIGIAGALLICLYVADEMSYDKMFEDADRIHRVNVDVKFGGEVSYSSQVGAPFAKTLLKDYAQIEEVTRFRTHGSYLVKQNSDAQNIKEGNISFVDSTFFDMFGVDLIVGNEETALIRPRSLILTRSAVEKHFPVEDAVGKTLILDNSDRYEITGVVEDFPENSFLSEYTILLAMSGYEDAQKDLWINSNYYTFFKLKSEANIEDFQKPLQEIFGRYIIPVAQRAYPGITEEQFIASGNFYNLSTVPLTDLHLHSNRNYEMGISGSIQNVYILSFIGLFLILLAAVNFINLATAQSLRRSKEVGIRKTLGSSKMGLVTQFLVEACLISFLSLGLALALSVLALPFFNTLADKTLTIPFSNPLFILELLAGTFILGLFSGIYPAFFVSRFNPVQVLKGSRGTDKSGGNIRNMLVILQFGISICLVVCTLVVFKQLRFMQKKDLGYSKEQVLLVEDVYGAGDKLEIFRQEVKNLGAVQEVAVSSFMPTSSTRSNSSFFKEGSMEQENAVSMQVWDVDYGYLKTLNLEIVAGRDFDPAYGNDSIGILINESAVSKLELSAEEAIGVRISRGLGQEIPKYSTIIGVVKNFHFENLREEIGALSMSLGVSEGYLAAKVQTGDIQTTVSTIEGIWQRMAPGQPFSYSFLDTKYDDMYNSEQRLGRIFVIFTILSIFIACLGLFGLAALNTEKRRKEIGIRKVLGASVSQIFAQLTLDFLKLVFIAIIISLPIAYIIMSKWLQDFSYKIDIGWGILLITAILALLISIITVGYQSIKAAIANPVKSLRTE